MQLHVTPFIYSLLHWWWIITLFWWFILALASNSLWTVWVCPFSAAAHRGEQPVCRCKCEFHQILYTLQPSWRLHMFTDCGYYWWSSGCGVHNHNCINGHSGSCSGVEISQRKQHHRNKKDVWVFIHVCSNQKWACCYYLHIITRYNSMRIHWQLAKIQNLVEAGMSTESLYM